MNNPKRGYLLLPLLIGCLISGCRDEPAVSTPEPKEHGVVTASREIPLHEELVKGREALSQGRLQEAEERFRKVPETDPSFLLAQKGLADILGQEGDYQESLRVYTRLAAMDTDNPELFQGLAWARYRLDLLEDAELAMLRSIELDADSMSARYDVAFFRLAQGRLPEAIEAYHRAMKMDRGMSYFKEAKMHVMQMAAEHEKFPEPHYVLAFMANARGQRQEELDELQRYLDMEPSGPAVEVARKRMLEVRQAIGSAEVGSQP